VLVVAAVVVGACGGSDRAEPGQTTSTSSGQSPFAVTTSGILGPMGAACHSTPPNRGQASFPWIPADLPIPSGAYVIAEPTNTGSSAHFGIFVVPLSLSDLLRTVLSTWPAAGWALGRGDSEPGEAEDAFAKGDLSGAFRARASFCDPTATEFLVVLGNRSTSATIQPTGTTGAPINP